MTALRRPTPRPRNEALAAPYTRSWVDRFTRWVDRLPIPAWTFYLGVALLTFSLVAGLDVRPGTLNSPQALGPQLVFGVLGAYFLGAIHFIDRSAGLALREAAAGLAVTRAQLRQLEHELTTMPAGPVRWLGAIGVAIALIFMPFSLDNLRLYGIAIHPLSVVFDLGLIAPFISAVFTAFMYHTFRQMRIVYRVLTRHARVSLFHMTPLYALSGLTARTALVLLVFSTLASFSAPSDALSTTLALRPANSGMTVDVLTTLGFVVLSAVLAAVVFAAPLMGIHRLMSAEKARLQFAVDRRLETLLDRIHHRVDSHNLRQADPLNKMLTSLLAERDMLARIPTWPWRGGTLSLVITVIVLPIILRLAGRVLERILGL